MDALIFDVDGTLWDSTSAVAVSWKMAAEAAGLDGDHITAERLQREFGKLMPDIIESLFPDAEAKQKAFLLESLLEEENRYLALHPPVLYDGVKELFQNLHEKGIRIAIVSNCQAGYIEILLEAHDLNRYVDGHLCPGDTGVAKAENIRLAMERFNLSDPAYVGDTLGDFTATKEAGLPFIFANYGFGSVPAPDYTITSPSELLELPIF